MPSPARPEPNVRSRVLDKTLAHVRQRRSQRREAVLYCGVLAVAVAFTGWVLYSPKPPPGSRTATQATDDSSPKINVVRVRGDRPLRLIQRVSNTLPSIPRIMQERSIDSVVTSVNDEELLANVSAGLVKDANGRIRLVRLP